MSAVDRTGRIRSIAPIRAINRGRTRADHLFALKVERSCADALTALVGGLDGE